MAGAPQTLMPLRDLSSFNSTCLAALSSLRPGVFDISAKVVFKKSHFANKQHVQ